MSDDMEVALKRFMLKLFNDLEVDKSLEGGTKKRLHLKCEKERDFLAYLSMLMMVRTHLNRQTFDMGIGIREVGKFGDLILATKKDNRKCRFIKVKGEEDRKIGLEDLINDENSDFDLVTYFFSYYDVLQGKFYDKEFDNEFILYTNCHLDMDCPVDKKSIGAKSWERLCSQEYNQKNLQDLLDPDMSDDDILDPYNKYKFNNIITPHIKSKINDRNVQRACEMIIDWILEEKSLNKIKYVVEPYFGYLIKNVINTKKNKFHKSFLKDMKTESPNVFRHAFKNAMLVKNVKMSKLKICLSDLDDVDELYSKSIADFNDVIKEAEIDEFFSSFIIASSQRKWESAHDVIFNFIIEYKQEEYMGNEFLSQDDVARYISGIVRQFTRVMRLWVGMRATDLKCPGFLNERIFKKLLSNHWHSNNRFEYKEPDEFFVGRSEQIMELYTKLVRGSSIVSQTVVIHGESGIGKSELIRNFIKTHGDRFEQNIMWIKGDSSKTIESTFKRIAVQKLKITVRNKWSVAILVEKVYTWFAKKKCLFVFDRVPDPKVMKDFLPDLKIEGNLPFVVISSVSPDWGDFETLHLTKLNVEESEELVSKCENSALRERVSKLLDGSVGN